MPASKYHSEVTGGETNKDQRYAEVKRNGRLRGMDKSAKEGAIQHAGRSDTPCVGTCRHDAVLVTVMVM